MEINKFNNSTIENGSYLNLIRKGNGYLSTISTTSGTSGTSLSNIETDTGNMDGRLITINTSLDNIEADTGTMDTTLTTLTSQITSTKKWKFLLWNTTNRSLSSGDYSSSPIYASSDAAATYLDEISIAYATTTVLTSWSYNKLFEMTGTNVNWAITIGESSATGSGGTENTFFSGYTNAELFPFLESIQTFASAYTLYTFRIPIKTAITSGYYIKAIMNADLSTGTMDSMRVMAKYN